MDNDSDALLQKQRENIKTNVRRLPWVRGLSEATVLDLLETAEPISLPEEEAIETKENGVVSVFFIVTGRVHVKVYDSLGHLVKQDWLTSGRVLGLLAIGVDDHSKLEAITVKPTTMIRLPLPNLLNLLRAHTDLLITLLGMSGSVARQMITVDRTLSKPAAVGIVHHSSASRQLTTRLATRLNELGESIAVAGDQAIPELPESIPFRKIIQDGRIIEGGTKERLLKDWADKERLLVEIDAGSDANLVGRLLTNVDVTLWCIRPEDAESCAKSLRFFEKSVSKTRDDTYIVWILDDENTIPPYLPDLHELVAGDFKLSFEAPRPRQAKLLSRGLERIVHHLRGIKLGLALGGGAARGMAHLGVLRALEDHGIFVDTIAGTSAGAMTGALYCTGLEPEYLAQCAKADLYPSWLFRHMPAGGHWYLVYKYRTGRFDLMLRKYLHHYHMQQLLLPMFMISADLVNGVPLIRTTGDATDNLLESINLPPLARPIIQSQQALVDGGFLNNVPANVLVEEGCNFVIASSVTAHLEKDFMGLQSRDRRRKKTSASTLKVMMRQSIVQYYNINSMCIEPADFVIKPDVTSFDLSAFTRADEMTEVGKKTANEAISELRQMLSRLDPQLFG